MLDSHCHLNDAMLYPKREKIIKEAEDIGVSLFLCVGWDVDSSKQAVRIAHEFPNVYAAVGLHPENLEGVNNDSLSEIRALAKDPKVLAIGEIGLDYHWVNDEKDRQKQKEWFIRQIDMANELSLAISIHARDALQDTYDILKSHPLFRGGVLHCYSGSTEMMGEFLKLGLYFGFGGPITYKGAMTPKANVRACPSDRILSETDSPYLPPVPFRGQANEPKHVLEILKEMAFLRNQDEKFLERQIQFNFESLFHVEHK
jgi:TatD DNase family protein